MTYRDRWIDRVFTNHVSIGGWFCLYGANAMHWALNVKTRWGYFCAHPTTRTFGGRWPWYVYLSPDATPTAAHWGFGPGFEERDPEDRRRARERREHPLSDRDLS